MESRLGTVVAREDGSIFGGTRDRWIRVTWDSGYTDSYRVLGGYTDVIPA